MKDEPTKSAGVERLVKHMTERFLAWKLPADFHPDAGISFKAEFNENTPWPMRYEPSGTNLLSYPQAEAMIRHLLDRAPSIEPEASGARAAFEEAAKLCERYVTPWGRAGSEPDACESAVHGMAPLIRALAHAGERP